MSHRNPKRRRSYDDGAEAPLAARGRATNPTASPSLQEQPPAFSCGIATRSPLAVPFAPRSASLETVQETGDDCETCATGPSSSPRPSLVEDPSQRQRHDSRLRPWICCLLVACDVLGVSVEAQFTAAVLLHRYQVLVSSSSSLSWVHGSQASDSEDGIGSREEERPSRDNGITGELLQTRHPPKSSEFTPHEILAACLFLACKSEEEPRRMRDIVNCVNQLSVAAQEIPDAAEDDPSSPLIHLVWDPRPLDLSPPNSLVDDDSSSSPYAVAKKRLVAAEQHVLRWIAFDCAVSHPHRAVVLLCREYRRHPTSSGGCEASAIAGDMDDVRVAEGPASAAAFAADEASSLLMRATWRRLNAAAFSVACLSHGVWPLACAAVDLELDLSRRGRRLQNPVDPSDGAKPDTSPADASGSRVPANDPASPLAAPSAPSLDDDGGGPAWYLRCGAPVTDEEVRAARVDLERAAAVTGQLPPRPQPGTSDEHGRRQS